MAFHIVTHAMFRLALLLSVGESFSVIKCDGGL